MFGIKNNNTTQNIRYDTYLKDGITGLLIVLLVNVAINLGFYCMLFFSYKSEMIRDERFDFSQFMSQYYITQSNWLNFWLFCLTIILAVIGIISAIDYRSKKEEMDKVIQDANYKIITNESKMTEMDKFINDAKLTIDENVFKMKEYMNQADKFAKEAKESERISEAYSWFSNGNKAFGEKKYEEAIENYTKAIEINENFVEAYFSKGAACLNLQRFDNAISDYKKILELDPNYVDVYYNLIEAYIYIDKLDKAIETINKFIQIEPSPYIYMEDYNEWAGVLKKSENKELAAQIINFIDEHWRKIDGEHNY